MRSATTTIRPSWRNRSELSGDRVGRRSILHEHEPRWHCGCSVRQPDRENPDPVARTNNYYTQDGYGGGSYVNCADPSAPGIAAVMEELHKQGVPSGNCEPGHYYLVNNYNMFWNQSSTHPRILGADSFTLPPQSIPTIADVLTGHDVSWKYYSGDRGNDPSVFPPRSMA
jgi:hypothetical protein